MEINVRYTIRFAVVLSLVICAAWESRAAAVDFANDVGPLIARHCLRCHKPGNAQGDISLATIEDLRENEFLSAGRPDTSHLLSLVTSSREEDRPQMPKEGPPLSADEREILRRWIIEGAPWPEGVVLKEPTLADETWWSLQPLADVAPPDVPSAPARWRSHPIDQFVFAELNANQLTPSPPAERSDLIRRVTYDLLGLPPTPDEVAAFVADDAPNAWDRLIDRLLNSPHYGERWGRHWLDVIRFGESRGFERNEIITNAWPFRDYVIRSFNEDKPFDRFVLEQLAGDIIAPGDPSIEVATTFLVCGPYDDVGNQDAVQAAQIRANTIDDIIRGTSEAFFGVTVGCARCHDHKFDPITQQDYYALYSIFAGVTHGEREVATPAARKERDEQRAPLERTRQKLHQQIASIDKSVQTRADQRAEEIAKRWTRPALQRTLTEETFSPIDTKFVRLIVEGAEENPAIRVGFRIDEMEVWTSGSGSRNVALASAGGRASGSSRVAQDFAAAYSADLTNDGRFGARWIADGSELTIELADVHAIDRVSFSSDRQGDAGDHSVAAFVSEYRIEASLDGKTWRPLADSHDRQPINETHRRHRLHQAVTTPDERQQLSDLRRQLAEINQQIAAVPALPRWWVGTTTRPAGPFHVFLGGDPQKPGEEVSPASLSFLKDVSPPDASLSDNGPERAALAEWIVDPRNPLTPRVLANRVWQYHFGTGLVDTPSDFGAMGSLPTHAALLDWLAQELITPEGEGGCGWRLKDLHRLILTSQAYQQKSAYREEALAMDAGSRLLWRYPPRRLSAEEIRDTMLFITGKLDPTMGGPGFKLYQYLQDNVATYVPLDKYGPETYRRSVYHHNARASRIDLMSDFDCPDPAFAAPRRAETTTPLQALTLMNHQFTLDMAAALTERIERDAGGDASAQVKQSFVLAFGRLPDPGELDSSVRFVTQYGFPALCRVLLNANEFVYVR
ncbi:MAG: DUF1553 domain-containing protein [Planctomycetaceae bacterium]|nr:DUF1553 domain-containing protein [Planctomycetaceae bacterium]